MKLLYKLCVVITAVLLTLCCTLAVSGKRLDPARENGIAEKAGYNLDEMETSIEILENGDEKVWYIDKSKGVEWWMETVAHRTPEDSDYEEIRSYWFDINDYVYPRIEVFDRESSIDGILIERLASPEGGDYKEYPVGDADMSHSVDLADVLLLRKILAGIETLAPVPTADANRDGFYNMKDVLLIRKGVAGMVTLEGTIETKVIYSQMGWKWPFD